MKNYIKFLFRAHRLKFIIVILMTTLLFNFGVKKTLEGFREEFYKEKNLLTFIMENPERYQEYYDITKDGTVDEYQPEEYDKQMRWLQENVKVEKDPKPIDQKSFDEYKKNMREVHERFPDRFRQYFHLSSFVKLTKDSSITRDTNYSGEEYIDLIERDNGAFIGQEHRIMNLVVFTFIAVIIGGFLTSMEHMTRFKMFEETIPLRRRTKYFAKLGFGTMWLIFYLLLNMVVFLIMSYIVIGPIVNIPNFLSNYLPIFLQGISYFALIMFVGSFTGNIFGHLAAMVPISLGYHFQHFLFPISNTESFFGNVNNMDKYMSMDIWPIMSQISLIFNNLNWMQIMVGLGAAVILSLIGSELYKRAKYENSGKFFTIRWIEIVYYILAVWCFASICTIITGGLVQGDYIAFVFIPFTLFFAKLFQRLFQIKVGV